MKRLKTGLVIGVTLAAMGLGGCMSTPPSPIGFNYQVDNGPANRIVQVFDLSGNTVVQIRNVDPKSTRIYNARNVEIPYKVMGENVVLEGLQNSFTVSSDRAASRVIRTAPVSADTSTPLPAVPAARAAAGANPGIMAATSSARDEKLLAEITRIKTELAELKRMLAAAEPPSTGNQSAIAHQAPVPTESTDVVRVSFANNSEYFAPPREVRDQLVQMAKSATVVEVRGFTDSAQRSRTSEALAKGRASAAKRFLMRHGVDGKKVRVEYEPAGKFVTDNTTAEGKAANRRVEIRAS
ncbi:OmpA family protein [Massilia sp. LjRoot122]|uniref:OmpA family protein n=1 Tax=Massilia sp. LjRoot122 TaxID=3342257 RepID=UPI003ED0C563